jgi:hypothetical protein
MTIAAFLMALGLVGIGYVVVSWSNNRKGL